MWVRDHREVSRVFINLYSLIRAQHLRFLRFSSTASPLNGDWLGQHTYLIFNLLSRYHVSLKVEVGRSEAQGESHKLR